MKTSTKKSAKVRTAMNAARNGAYVKRVVEDDQLRDNLKLALVGVRNAYGRVQTGKGKKASALFEDKKLQRELRQSAEALREATHTLKSGSKKRQRNRKGGLVGKLLLVGAGASVALIASEKLRNKVLDMVFGPEEEFEYVATDPVSGASVNGTPASNGAEASTS